MNYEDLKSTNLAFASKAWRNSGIKAPITVMFECFTPTNQSAHQRMLSRALGNGLVNRKTFLLNYTEDNFTKEFSSFGFTAENVDTYEYLDSVQINVSSKDLLGEDLILRRVDTTDDALVKNPDGSLKPQWSVKTVNGQELTFDGALIYTTVEFAEPGMPDATLKQDQNLSRSITNMTANPVEAIQENKAKTKATAEVF